MSVSLTNWSPVFINDTVVNTRDGPKKVPYIYTVGKHTPCGLSFVYTSYIRYGVRAVPKFGKHALLCSYHKGKKYV